MVRNGDISHSGKIMEITPEYTTVEIVSGSACSSCHAKSFCGLGESVSKAVQVPTRSTEFAVGDEVQVVLKRSMGFKAVWLAYVIPLFILLAVLLPLLSLGAGELVSSLSAFGAVALYYFIVFLMRERLRNEYSFYITR